MCRLPPVGLTPGFGSQSQQCGPRFTLRKLFTYNSQGPKCCGQKQAVCMRLSAEWGMSGTLITPHSPSYAPKPGALLSSLLQGFSGLWEAWDTSLCSSFLPPIAHSAGPRLFPEAPSPLPPRGPLACGFGPTHFLCRPNSALSRGGKFLSSRRAAPPPSFPAGQESPKQVGRGVGLPGLRPKKGSDSSAVTQPQPRLGQLGTLRGERKDSHPATAKTFSH